MPDFIQARPMPAPAVPAVMVVTVAFWLWQQVAFNGLLAWLALWPPGAVNAFPGGQALGLPGFQPWQLVTYSLLHGSFGHLFFNMFAVWMFGTQIERVWGSARFLIYYFACVVGAGLTQLLVAAGGLTAAPTIGASGGVFGLLLAYGMMFPNNRVMLLFPPIPMRAKWFVLGFGVLELFLGVANPGSKVAHFAHLGGMAFGLLLIQYWRGRFPFARGDLHR